MTDTSRNFLLHCKSSVWHIWSKSEKAAMQCIRWLSLHFRIHPVAQRMGRHWYLYFLLPFSRLVIMVALGLMAAARLTA